MADIILSNAVRSNLLSLQQTTALLGKTQERLSTGLKVNSALDDPTAFFTASSLNSRASDLNRLLDSVGNAVQTVKAADEGISSITKLVETAQATARQALLKPGPVTPSVHATASSAALANDAAVAAITGQLTITGTAGAATLDFDVIATEADLAAAIGAASTASGTTIAFTVGGGSTLDVTAAAGESFTISGTHAGLGGTLANGTINPTAGTPVNNVDRAALETEYNNLLIQIDQLASDASFNGVNLLSGDNLSVIFNEDGTSKLDINGVTFNSAGLAINAATTDAFQTNTGVNASLAELDAAIGTLRQQASTFGSNLSVVEIRQDFTKNLINTLETGAANLTLADTNEEGANLLALQTRQQLSTIALSLATQADQNVLRLF